MKVGIGLSLFSVGPIGAPLTISPTSATDATSGTRTFTASGGTSPYTYSLVGDTTGSSINSSTGVLTEGPLEGSFTVRATDAASAHADALMTLTFTDPALASNVAVYDPSNASNVTASGGLASAVTNSSGSFGALSQASSGNQPGYGSTTINSLKTLHQNGSAFMVATAAAEGDFHVMIVASLSSVAAAYHALAAFAQSGQEFQPAFYAPGLQISPAKADMYFNSGTSTADHNFSQTLTTGTHLFEFWRSGVTLGCSVDAVDSTVAGGATSTSNRFVILSSSDAGSEYGQADIGEVRIYSAALTGTNRTANTARLKQKWATP